MTTSILHNQRVQINEIRELIEKTRKVESEILLRLSEEQNEADKTKEAALLNCEDLAQSKKITIEQSREQQTAEVEKRRSLEPKILKERHDKRLSEIEEEADELSEDAEAKLNEAHWLAESVYEAAISKPKERLEALETKLNKQLEKLDILCEEVPQLLSKLRRKNISIDEDYSDAFQKPMDQFVEDAAKALETIRCDKRSRWFVGFRPVLIVLLVAIIVSASVWLWSNNLTAPIVSSFIAVIIASISLRITFASGSHSLRAKMGTFHAAASAARRVYEHDINAADRKCRKQEASLKETRRRELKNADDKFGPRLREVERLFKKDVDKEQKRFDIVEKKLTEKLSDDANKIQETYNNAIASIEQERQNTLAKIEIKHATTTQNIETERSETLTKLRIAWKAKFASFTDNLDEQRSRATELHDVWADTDWNKWIPPTEPLDRIQLGSFYADLTTIGGDLPTDQQLQITGPSTESIPLCMTLPRDASLLISTSGALREQAIAVLQNAVLRVLTAVPPGKVKFTLIDPVGLGETFAGILHLADYEESQLLDRAWTESKHIDQQLSNLTQHMETVIQKYLRNEFSSIDEYNEQAGEIAEPYRFLVLADFPTSISDNSAKRLASIITSGAKCGVHVIMCRDTGQTPPLGIGEDTLHRFAMRLIERDGELCIDENGMRDLPLATTQPPDDNTTTTIVKTVGEIAESTHRVEVPFNIIAPRETNYWSRSTANTLSVPLGRAGATKLQNLILGRGTAQHALIAGKTGSGKSTLLHVLITNLALWHSPEEVEFYLVDFKKGVEFKTYSTHKLPHARVVAVESDREFGVSVLQKLDQELKNRGELFREKGVQDIPSYLKKYDEPLPRIILIVDEFQEFFVDDDKLAQEASLLLDRIVRQGRAFGIHAVLGSQTLDGAYTLGRSTMGQMAVRIALQCSEADSYIILSEDNSAARLLSRPGEAIYNDSAGSVEGNSPFQVVWLDEQVREEQLSLIRKLDNNKEREMVVYEGNTPVNLHKNAAFVKAKASTPTKVPATPKVWLGAAMAVKEDTYAVFRHATANNLLIVGQQEEVTTTLITSTMQSLDGQFPENELHLTLLDGTHGDATYASLISDISKHLTCKTNLISPRKVETTIQELGKELDRRLSSGKPSKPTHFLIVNGLQRFRDLRRNEDDYGFGISEEAKSKTPSQIFAELIKEGPSLGMHLIIATDTLANLNRSIDRQGLREFDLRVLLQMGNNDSSNLIDSTAASKLGMHRALLYSEETGAIEPFRPYSMPVISELVTTSK